MGPERVVALALLCAALAQGAVPATPPSAPFERKLWWMDAKVRVAPSRKIERLSTLARNAKVLYKKQPCEQDLTSMLWTNEVSMYLNGSLEMQLDSTAAGPTQKLVLPPEDYCVDRTTVAGKLHLAFLACPCKRVVCVRKCCDNKRMLTVSEAVAVEQDVHCAARLPQSVTWHAPFTALTARSERRHENVTYARLRGPFSKNCPSGRMNVMIEMSPTTARTILPAFKLDQLLLA
ncbi:Protein of unknown function [Gryllus bimaculatus]|nr:Protein of unknown function [Gryllus bimaculatus]